MRKARVDGIRDEPWDGRLSRTAGNRGLDSIDARLAGHVGFEIGGLHVTETLAVVKQGDHGVRRPAHVGTQDGRRLLGHRQLLPHRRRLKCR